EICFAAQWAIILRKLGTLSNAETTLNAAKIIVPLIVLAECCSWYAVLTTNYLGNAIENSIWAIAFLGIGTALCGLLHEFNGAARFAVAMTLTGVAGYLAFLITIDVPMYLSRWHADLAAGRELLGVFTGIIDVSTRWVVTHEFLHWKEEI